MSPASEDHGPDNGTVLLYALRALASSEAAAAGTHIASCAECRQEFESLRPIIDSLVAWRADVLRPSSSVWERIARQIAQETGREVVLPSQQPPVEPEWKEVGPGISCQLLATDLDERRVTMLVRLAPGAEYPSHRHAGVEELHLLHGEVVVDDRKLYPGDYLRSAAGSVDRRVWSESGCTGILITSLDDALL